jgi:hypothetical protein
MTDKWRPPFNPDNAPAVLDQLPAGIVRDGKIYRVSFVDTNSEKTEITVTYEAKENGTNGE